MTRPRASHTVRRVFRVGVLLFALLAPAGLAAEPVAPAVEVNAPEGAPVVAPAPALIPEPEIPHSEPPGLGPDDDLSVGWTLIRTMLVLGIVIALAWLTLNVGLRRLMGIKPVVGTPVVTVLERVALDQKRALFVVEAAGEVLLIGGGDGSLSLLTKLERGQIEKLQRAREGAGVQLSPFLQKLLGRNSAPTPGEAKVQSVAADVEGAAPVKETK